MDNIGYLISCIIFDALFFYGIYRLVKAIKKPKKRKEENYHITIDRSYKTPEPVKTNTIETENSQTKNEEIKPEEFNYAQKYLLTKNEYIFWIDLKKICDKRNWLICPKVDLKELFTIQRAKKDKEYMSQLGKISQKNIDFIICDNKLRPLYAIELDDNTHKQEDRQKRDQFINELFAHTKIKLIRIKAQKEYTENYIKQFFEKIEHGEIKVD